MCGDICVNLSDKHWSDCDTCADGFIAINGDPQNGCKQGVTEDCNGANEKKCGDICVNLNTNNWSDCNTCKDGYIAIDGAPQNGCLQANEEGCIGNQRKCDGQCIVFGEKNWSACKTCKDGYEPIDGDPNKGCYDPNDEEHCENVAGKKWCSNECVVLSDKNWKSCGVCADSFVAPSEDNDLDACECADGLDICDNKCVDFSKMHWNKCNTCADGFVAKDGDPQNGCECANGGAFCNGSCIDLEQMHWKTCNVCKNGYQNLDNNQSNGCEALDCNYYNKERCSDNQCYDFKTMNWKEGSNCGVCRDNYQKDAGAPELSSCYDPTDEAHCGNTAGKKWCNGKCITLSNYNWSDCNTCIDASFVHESNDKTKACTCPNGQNKCDNKCIDLSEKNMKSCNACADGFVPKVPGNIAEGCVCEPGKELCNGSCIDYDAMNWSSCNQCADGFEHEGSDKTTACVCNTSKTHCEDLKMCVDLKAMNWKSCGVCADTFTRTGNDTKKACECAANNMICQIDGKDTCIDKTTTHLKSCTECEDGYIKGTDGTCFNPNCEAGKVYVAYDNALGYVCGTPIRNAQEFIQLRDDWNDGKIQDKASQVYILTDDIYLGSIAQSELDAWFGFSDFTATLLSDGKTITTRTIDGQSHELKCANNYFGNCGIFTSATKATFRNFNVDVKINNTENNMTTGCLVANISGGDISNINVKCEINSLAIEREAGGLIGYLNNEYDTNISNITISGVITAMQSTVGGLIGRVVGAHNTKLNIQNVVIEGKAKSPTKLKGSIVGGVIGLYKVLTTNRTSILNTLIKDNTTIDAAIGGGFIGHVDAYASDDNERTANLDLKVDKIKSAATLTSNRSSSYATLAGIIGKVSFRSLHENKIEISNAILSSKFEETTADSNYSIASLIYAIGDYYNNTNPIDIKISNIISKSQLSSNGNSHLSTVGNLHDTNITIENSVFIDNMRNTSDPIVTGITYKHVYFYEKMGSGVTDDVNSTTYRAFSFNNSKTPSAILAKADGSTKYLTRELNDNVKKYNNDKLTNATEWLLWKVGTHKLDGKKVNIPLVEINE